MNNKLEIKHLSKQYGSFAALSDVSFTLEPGVTGLLGANGAGKSTLMKLMTDHMRRTEGEILWNGTEILTMGSKWRELVGYTPQLQGLYDEFTARRFLYYMGALKGMRRKEIKAETEEMLEAVNLSQHAHKKIGTFSGGMRQRVMIAMGIIARPRLLIADEPTTALDVTIQAQILDLIRTLRDEEKTAVMFITHDLGVVADIAHRAVVMYAGSIMEMGTVHDMFLNPLHPYTQGLLGAIPRLSTPKGKKLYTIPGIVPDLSQLPKGCPFCTRCDRCMGICHEEKPPLRRLEDGREVRCFHVEGGEIID